jgi:hypothetical protein
MECPRWQFTAWDLIASSRMAVAMPVGQDVSTAMLIVTGVGDEENAS